MLSREATSGRLAHHREIFLGLAGVATDAARAGRHEEAAAFVQLAARYAGDNHPATFASPGLETILAGVGAATMPPSTWPATWPATVPTTGGPTGRAGGGDGPGRVLHVLTKAIGVGGHTRYALRWLEHDEGRVHSLALTGQKGKVPAALAAAVAASDGELRILGTRPAGGGLVARAAQLRAMAAGADVVVLYTDPHDVVPVIALAGADPRPPVLFVNHADHCFWIGRATADLVACIRGQGTTIATERRGIPLERCALLPIPLAPARRQRSRDEAKAELGLSPSAVLLLTVAAAYKYEPIDDIDFLDLIEPVVAANPDAVLLAVGPSGRRWQRAEGRTGGRIRALGPQPGIQRYYEACDVYLDSHPVSSATSLLEAASLGTPAMTLCPYEGGAAVLCSEDPGLDGLETRAAKPGDYGEILRRLVDDAGLRASVGRVTAARIASAHATDRWRAEVAAIYERLGRVGHVGADLGSDLLGPGDPGLLDEVLCQIQAHPVLRPGLFADVYRELDHLPRRLRRREWANLAVDEGGRKLLPAAGLGRHDREQRFVRAAARTNLRT